MRQSDFFRANGCLLGRGRMHPGTSLLTDVRRRRRGGLFYFGVQWKGGLQKHAVNVCVFFFCFLHRILWSLCEGLTLVEEFEKIMKEGLTGGEGGSGNGGPLLINRRRDTPKVFHSETHNGGIHQAEPGAESGSTKSRKQKTQAFLVSFLLYRMKACSPKVHIPFSQTVLSDSPLVSFVNKVCMKGWHISKYPLPLFQVLWWRPESRAPRASKCSSLFCREGRGLWGGKGRSVDPPATYYPPSWRV